MVMRRSEFDNIERERKPDLNLLMMQIIGSRACTVYALGRICNAAVTLSSRMRSIDGCTIVNCVSVGYETDSRHAIRYIRDPAVQLTSRERSEPTKTSLLHIKKSFNVSSFGVI